MNVIYCPSLPRFFSGRRRSAKFPPGVTPDEKIALIEERQEAKMKTRRQPEFS